MPIIKPRKGFTLIELIVVIAILGILVLLAAPRFADKVRGAEFTKHMNDATVLENSGKLYYKDNEKFPIIQEKVDKDGLIESLEENETFAFNSDGTVHQVEENEDYHTVNYDSLKNYAKVSNKKEDYLMLAPSGEVIFLNKSGIPGQDDSPIKQSPDGNGRTISMMNYNHKPSKNNAGETVEEMTYNDSKDIMLHGLKKESFDGDLSTGQDAPGTLTWDGNLTHREITITGIGRNGGSYEINPKDLTGTFIDKDGERIPEISTGEMSFIIAGYRKVATSKLVVPEGAVALKLEVGGYLYDGKIYEVEVSANKSRPKNVKVTSETTPKGVAISSTAEGYTVINRNGKFLAKLDKDVVYYASPESLDSEEYEVFVFNEFGNGQLHKHKVASSHLIMTEKASYNNDNKIFDRDLETYSRIGTRTLELGPGAIHKAISVTAIGSGGNWGTSPRNVVAKFLDVDGKELMEERTGKKEAIIAGATEIKTTKLIVPTGAVKMVITIEYPRDNAHLYDVTTSEVISRPENVIIGSETTIDRIKFNWTGENEVIIKKNGALIANVMGQNEYVATPSSFTDGNYEFILVDSEGNSQSYTHKIKNENLLIKSNSITPAAFDGDMETSHRGVGAIQIKNEAKGKEIDITSRGTYGTVSETNVFAKFLDNDKNIIPDAKTGSMTTKIAGPYNVKTSKMTIPEEATSLEIYSDRADFGVDIYDISISDPS